MRLMSPRPPSLRGRVILSVADLGWCMLCFVNVVRVARCSASSSVFVHGIMPNEYVSVGTAKVLIALILFLALSCVLRIL